ncbi:hypothetical protein [Nocardioides sp. NPDC047086]|uniref:hypothetical protein n=1 Tax=Nocardioides sp. NPDC047086 TaxID=3154810 RepID=UPI0033C72FFD
MTARGIRPSSARIITVAASGSTLTHGTHTPSVTALLAATIGASRDRRNEFSPITTHDSACDQFDKIPEISNMMLQIEVPAPATSCPVQPLS